MVRDDDNSRMIGLAIIGTVLGGFLLYWLGRGLWWIAPKVIFVGIPILVLSFLISRVLMFLVSEKEETVTSGISFKSVSFYNVVLAQALLVVLFGAFILNYREEVQINEQGQEIGKVIQYSKLHYTYNNFAAAWQRASPYQAQSEEKYKTELFDLWYVELIIFGSLFFGAMGFLSSSRAKETEAVYGLKAQIDKMVEGLKIEARDEIRRMEDRMRAEKKQSEESYRELKSKYHDLEHDLRRLKAKDEFTRKDQAIAKDSGSLESDVF